MITEKDIQPGARFVSKRANLIDKELTIKSISGNWLTYELNGSVLSTSIDYIKDFLNYYKYSKKEKPLDKAFKTLDKIYCQHKNIVKDTWFTSRVYKHCRDCGAAIE